MWWWYYLRYLLFTLLLHLKVLKTLTNPWFLWYMHFESWKSKIEPTEDIGLLFLPVYLSERQTLKRRVKEIIEFLHVCYCVFPLSLKPLHGICDLGKQYTRSRKSLAPSVYYIFLCSNVEGRARIYNTHHSVANQ